MHIEKFVIENFKRFKRVELDLNADVNVLTGVNNSGKTSVLEALSLWAECFQKLLLSAIRADAKTGQVRGQYRLGEPASNYFRSDEIQSVRSAGSGDIFHDLGDERAEVLLSATLSRSARDSEPPRDELTVQFKLRPVRAATATTVNPRLNRSQRPFIVNSGRDMRSLVYDIVHVPSEAFDALRFNDFFREFPQPIQSVFASPVATISPREEFLTPPALRARVLARDSAAVVRNRLYQLRKEPSRFDRLLLDASFVLFNRTADVELQFDGDERSDVDLAVRVRLDPKEPFRDLCLLGSGSLQVLEILLGIHGVRSDLNLVLLDEPDSHLHRDLQRRLLDVLSTHAKEEGERRCQVFLSTHNEALIRSTRAEHIFHLESVATKTYRPISHDAVGVKKQGLQPSRHIKVLQSLGSESALDYLNALEARRVVLVEGDDDARYIQAIVERISSTGSFHAMYWAFQGIDTLLLRLDHYRTGIFESIRNERTLWEKAALVFDADFVTDDERTEIEAALRGTSGYKKLPVFLWPAYTIESTVLIDRARLAEHLVDLIYRDTGAAPPSDVAVALDGAWRSLLDEKRRQIDDQKLLRSIEAQRADRRKNLEHGLGIRLKSLSSVSTYLPWARQLLAQGFAHHIANKDDVSQLIGDVYRALELSFSPDGLFERLVASSKPNTRPNAWDELARAIR